MTKLTPIQWVGYVVFHPVDGFEDMRWKKAGSLKIAFIIVFLLFFALIAHERLYGFQFGSVEDKTFSIVPYFMKSMVAFAVWVVGNWAVCTIFSGEGTMRNICIYSAYSLVPFIVQMLVNVMLSHVLVRDEAVFMQIIRAVGILWSVLLMFSAVRSVHGYSAAKTFFAIVLTLASALIMLILFVLLLSLIQQIYIFISTIVTEITYRLRV
ncbi:MAG TPA: Yip1 family protein [Ruminococcus sp.]